jgi:hypothetical protein
MWVALQLVYYYDNEISIPCFETIYRGGKQMHELWVQEIKKVQEKVSSIPSWRSDQRHLVEIFRAAEAMGIEPNEVDGTDICKLRTIVKEARHAIERNNTKRLRELFHLAATKTIVELRLALGSVKTDVVLVRRMIIQNQEKYVLTLDPEQFARVKQSMRLFFSIYEIKSNQQKIKSKELLLKTTTRGQELNSFRR